MPQGRSMALPHSLPHRTARLMSAHCGVSKGTAVRWFSTVIQQAILLGTQCHRSARRKFRISFPVSSS